MALSGQEHLEVAPISAPPRERVLDFLRAAFPLRSPQYFTHLDWHYRLGYDPASEPIVAVLPEGRVVGLAAAIPGRLRLDGAEHRANWYVDFAIAADLQRRGIGQALTQAWVTRCDTWLGQPNERSIGLLLKQGWRQSYGGYRFAMPLRPAALLRTRGANRALVGAVSALQPAYAAMRRLATRGVRPLELRPIAAVAADLSAIVTDAGPFGLVHDHAWLQWRLVQSPVAHQHFHAHDGAAHLVLRVLESGGLRRAHILYVSDAAPEADVLRGLRRLVAWALANEIDVLWTVCSHPMLVKVLGSVFPSRLDVPFVHDARGAIKQALLERVLPVQAMDTDADIIYGA